MADGLGTEPCKAPKGGAPPRGWVGVQGRYSCLPKGIRNRGGKPSIAQASAEIPN